LDLFINHASLIRRHPGHLRSVLNRDDLSKPLAQLSFERKSFAWERQGYYEGLLKVLKGILGFFICPEKALRKM
jgi:hypothetical protein